MQNKSIIKFLVATIALVCLYELSFTYFAKQVEKEAKYEAGDNYEEYFTILKEKEDEEIWMGFTYKECKQREINLGLDLRGGVSVTLEISMEELVRSMSGDNANSLEFKQVEDRAQELLKSESGSYVDAFYKAFKEVGPKQPFATWFITRDTEFDTKTSDSEVLDILKEYSDDAINQANQVLRERVKQFGIAQPDIRKLGNTGRIMVDLPGVKDISRVRKLLQGSANLQFWNIFDIRDIKNELKLAADLYDAKYNESAIEDAEVDSTLSDSAKLANSVLNENKSNPFREALLAGYSYFTIVSVKDTAQVNEFLRSPGGKKSFPSKMKFAWDSKISTSERGAYLSLYFLQKDRYGKPLMEGDIIKYARADYDPTSGQKIVSLDFKSNYIKPWEDITTESYNNKTPIVIVLDGVVYSAPVASSIISTGSTMISGGGNDSEFWNKDLANVLNAGKFPAPAKIVEESLIGPTLGQEAIQSATLSFIIALLIVLVYMVFYYSTAGWVANVALIANIFFIIGALAAAPTISLTLPGIAGIVLTIGMSVDANVLIYERIREELRMGKKIKTAIADGYKNAYTAILDANVTTLITGIILWYFGSGVIESFAQTLVIGIFTSLFSAIFISRLIFDALLDKDKKINFSTSFSESLFINTAVQFIKGRKKFYLFSGLLILIGLFSIATKGFDLGTDFSGGRTYKVNFVDDVDANTVREDLASVFVDENGLQLPPEVKAVKGGETMIITTKYLYNNTTKDASAMVEQKLFEGIKGHLPADMDFAKFTNQDEGKTIGLMQSYVVGPTIADDIIDAAITSILIALSAIFLYVAVRFRKWQFGLGAIIAIFHDVIIVLGLFSLFSGVLPFSLEINQAFVAAILTVVGYSINDTVVVFDRIRELNGVDKKGGLIGLINSALNSTLSRTFNTSITIFVVLLAILIFGGESIQGFAFALIVGVVVGTYSSLFIASPVYYDLTKKKEEDK